MKVVIPLWLFNTGLTFLKKLSKDVVLAYVIEIMPLTNHYEVRKDIERKLEKVAKKLEENGFETKTIVRLGNPGLDVARVAERERADIIVVPVAEGFRRYVYGTLTNGVLTFSKIPVLVVKENLYSNNVFERPLIALPLDDPEFCLYILNVLRRVRRLVKHAIFYYAGKDDEKLKYYAERSGLSYELLREDKKGNLAKQILKAAENVNATSIVVGRKPRLLDSVIMLGTAATIVRKSKIPVLVIPRVKNLWT